MRLGGNIQENYGSPEEWLNLVHKCGYSCVLAPVDEKSDKDVIESYRICAEENDLVMGEVGIWKNMLSLNSQERHEAVEYSIKRLGLANDLHANCCVNVCGTRGDLWYGLYKENYLPETYESLVETVQLIIDAVNPQNTFFTIEPMPWMIPDSPEQYVKLIKDINRKAFGVHLDFVNMINTPYKFAHHQDFIKSCFDILGAHIKSIHMKDIRQVEGIPFSFAVEECPPGEGVMDFKPILKLCESLGPDTSVFVEHMKEQDHYVKVVEYLREEGKKAGISIK